MYQSTPKLVDVVRGYYIAKKAHKEQDYVLDRIEKIKAAYNSSSIASKDEATREIIFLNLVGVDTEFADFGVLEVMANTDFSSKHVAYLAAAQTWHPKSPVVLMATNRIQRDLTASNYAYASLALSSFGPYMSKQLANNVATDVVALMSSHKPYIRQKAIITFYHICLRYPEALKLGFSILRTNLADEDNSIVFTTLTVMTELCAHNAQNFIALIPKFHKMITSVHNNWIIIRLLSLLKMLAIAEPRLPKKLIVPLKTVIESTTSVSVLIECVRTMLDIKINDKNLFATATNKIEAYLEHPEPNLRFLCMKIFVDLIKLQTGLVARHKDLISRSLESPDEPTREIALDLLCALASNKTIDTIISRMYQQYKETKTLSFRNMLITRVINLCAANNYELVSDFDWYVSVLFDFIECADFTCYGLVARQLLDLARRVPSTRSQLVEKCGPLFSIGSFKSAPEILLAAAHILGEYAEDSKNVKKVLQPFVANTPERVQAACIDSAFRLYMRSKTREEAQNLESLFELRLPLFMMSGFAEVQDRAASVASLLRIIKSKDAAFEEIQKDFEFEKVPKDEIEKPPSLNDPIDLFEGPDDPAFNEFEELPQQVEQQEATLDEALGEALADEKQGVVHKLPKLKKRKQNTSKERIIILDADSLFEQAKPKDEAHHAAGLLSEGLAKVVITDEPNLIINKETAENSEKTAEKLTIDTSKLRVRRHKKNTTPPVAVKNDKKQEGKRHHGKKKHHHHSPKSTEAEDSKKEDPEISLKVSQLEESGQ